MKCRIAAPARRELEEAIATYDAQRPGLGSELANEVEAAIQRVLQNPTAWRRIIADIRRHRVHRFPYEVIYQIRDDVVVVHAVAHVRRRPFYWRGRL